MGSYRATMIANQTLEFTIPVPAYSFNVTKLDSGTVEVYVTGDGTQPVIPNAEQVTTGTQVCLAPAIGAKVTIKGNQPGSALTGPGQAGPTGTTLPQVLMLSSGTPTVLVEW